MTSNDMLVLKRAAIRDESEKAYRVEADATITDDKGTREESVQFWLPMSQVTVTETTNGNRIISVPRWLLQAKEEDCAKYLTEKRERDIRSLGILVIDDEDEPEDDEN